MLKEYNPILSTHIFSSNITTNKTNVEIFKPIQPEIIKLIDEKFVNTNKKINKLIDNKKTFKKVFIFL